MQPRPTVSCPLWELAAGFAVDWNIRILGQIADFAARAEFIWDKFGADFAKIDAHMQPAADVLNKIVEWEPHPDALVVEAAIGRFAATPAPDVAKS